MHVAQAGRRAFDFYPTPWDTVKALDIWRYSAEARAIGYIPGLLPVFDLCAGDGTILKAITSPLGVYALEIQERFRGDLANLCKHQRLIAPPVIGDALKYTWPCSEIVTNTPYGAELMAFLTRIEAHAHQWRCWAFALTRMQWWTESTRLLHHRPAALLFLSWRPRFVKGTQSTTDRFTYCWAAFDGRAPTAPPSAGGYVQIPLVWLPRPERTAARAR